MNNNTKIIKVLLVVLLGFFFRWTIIDSLLFFVTRFGEYKTSKTYINSDLGFSAEYPSYLPNIIQRGNGVTFGHEVPWIIVDVTGKKSRLSHFILKQESNRDTLLRHASRWHFFYHPILGSKGYSLNVIDHNLAVCVGSPAIAGAGGRSVTCYLSHKDRIYTISTCYLPRLPKNYIELNKFLSSFKTL